jgi:hypothetical protein
MRTSEEAGPLLILFFCLVLHLFTPTLNSFCKVGPETESKVKAKKKKKKKKTESKAKAKKKKEKKKKKKKKRKGDVASCN